MGHSEGEMTGSSTGTELQWVQEASPPDTSKMERTLEIGGTM